MGPQFDTKWLKKLLFQGITPCFYLSNRIGFIVFEAHLSNRFYRASINRQPLIVPNNKGHFSISAGV